MVTDRETAIEEAMYFIRLAERSTDKCSTDSVTDIGNAFLQTERRKNRLVKEDMDTLFDLIVDIE